MDQSKLLEVNEIETAKLLEKINSTILKDANTLELLRLRQKNEATLLYLEHRRERREIRNGTLVLNSLQGQDQSRRQTIPGQLRGLEEKPKSSIKATGTQKLPHSSRNSLPI